jgi:eukaryotic-like serine/threonine-protein kinase
MQITEVLRNGSPNWVDIESILEAFELRYREEGSASLDDYLIISDDPNFAPLLAELIRIDLELSRQCGRPHSLDWHLSRFPHLLSKKDTLKELAFEEYRLRVAADENPSATEYAKRYGIDTSSWGQHAGPAATNILRDVSVVKTPTGSAVVSAPASRAKFPNEGELFAGFRLRSELGRGAFARVYLAEQGDLANRPVALKVSQQFVEESQTLAQLQHTNIVPIHSIHRQGRFHAVCMPYLGRTTLADIIKTWGRGTSLPHSGHGFVSTVANQLNGDTVLPDGTASQQAEAQQTEQPVTPLEALKKMSHEDAALWVAAELADGLAHAHQRGIWHRDLKPANVLLGEDGVPRLLDFNLSSGTEQIKQSVGGTPFYMAPEQLRAMKGDEVKLTAKIDQYALGLLLFELLTGPSPQEAEAKLPSAKLPELLKRRLEPPRDPRSCNPALRFATAEIVM